MFVWQISQDLGLPPRMDSAIEEFDETAPVDDSGFGTQIQLSNDIYLLVKLLLSFVTTIHANVSSVFLVYFSIVPFFFYQDFL